MLVPPLAGNPTSDRDSMTTPTAADIERIVSHPDPVVRNLQITQGYADLSAAFHAWLPEGANWCSLGVWASKQAGQSIRCEDVTALLRQRIDEHPPLARALNDALPMLGVSRATIGHALAQALSEVPAVARVAEIVARGNVTVFSEIGAEFARFLRALPAVAGEGFGEWAGALRPGPSPAGQDLLVQAFEQYALARRAGDAAERAQRILFANLSIAVHEQVRVQPDILAAMDAALPRPGEAEDVLRKVFSQSFGRVGPLGSGVRVRLVHTLASHVRALVREVITERLMTIMIPPRRVLRLGLDLRSQPALSLRTLTLAPLLDLLGRLDERPDTPVGSAARDWGRLEDRLRFIAELFRIVQEDEALFTPPFSPGQVAALRDGRVPAGQL